MNTEPLPPIPSDTANAARAVFGKDHFYLVIGDQANKLFSGLTLRDAAQRVRKPTNLQAVHYLVTIFQYFESLPDNLTEEAIRKRVDWKYALHLPLNYVDMNASKLCEFRKYLLADLEGQHNLQMILHRLSDLLVATGKLRLNHEALHVIHSVCLSSRLAKVWVTVGNTIGGLAIKQPHWLREISLPHWYDTYGQHSSSLKGIDENTDPVSFAQGIGSDGRYLLEAIAQSGMPDFLDLPEVISLKLVMHEQYESDQGKMLFRIETCQGCSLPGKFLN